eukprot:SAG22_NODE_428_length_10591_cov_8.858178_7_plen_205_part_00
MNSQSDARARARPPARPPAGPTERRVLNVCGTGTCFGDWGVVNNKRRVASCIAATDCELLVMHEFDFRATSDPTLFAALSGVGTESADAAPSAAAAAPAPAAAAAAAPPAPASVSDPGAGGGGGKGGAAAPAPVAASFALISRRDTQRAVVGLKSGENTIATPPDEIPTPPDEPAAASPQPQEEEGAGEPRSKKKFSRAKSARW